MKACGERDGKVVRRSPRTARQYAGLAPVLPECETEALFVEEIVCDLEAVGAIRKSRPQCDAPEMLKHTPECLDEVFLMHGLIGRGQEELGEVHHVVVALDRLGIAPERCAWLHHLFQVLTHVT